MTQLISDRSRFSATGNSTAFTTSAGANYRVGHRVQVAARQLRLMYHNQADWSTTNLAELVVKAAIEIGGTPTRVTFSGADSVTIPAGERALSDAIDMTVADDDVVYTRTYVHSNGSGGYWPGLTPAAGEFNDNVSEDGIADDVYKFYTDSDSTLLDTATYQSLSVAGNAFGFWPSAILGELKADTRPVYCVGDSICAGQGAGRELGGFIEQAARVAGYPVANAGMPGNKAQELTFALRWAAINPAFTEAAALITNLGTNDIGAGRTLVQLKADTITAAGNAQAIGLEFYACTLLPRTSSTDGWVTTGNQTVLANESIRVGYNQWLRGGPAELDGYIEAANLVETSEDSGIWQAPGGVNLTSDGIHPTEDGYTQIAASLDLSALPLAEAATTLPTQRRPTRSAQRAPIGPFRTPISPFAGR